MEEFGWQSLGEEPRALCCALTIIKVFAMARTQHIRIMFKAIPD
jgi:hypothetical protein